VTAEHTLAVSATFTAEPIDESLGFWFERLKLPFKIRHAAFNQIFQTLLDPAGLFSGNSAGGVNVVLLRWQDLGEPDQLPTNADSLMEALRRAAPQMRVPLVVVSCPCSVAFLENFERAGLVAELDAQLSQNSPPIANLNVLTANAVADLYPVPAIHDPVGERLGEIPYTSDFFTALGTCLVRKILALARSPYKVAVLDLDNTMWAGIVGEDGWDQVRIEPSHLALQEFLLEQRKDGMLLAVCSKNNEKDAWDVFERRPEMLLKKDHFASWRIDWNPKSGNIPAIAKELSLGSDSFIFLDDDVKECAEMRANAPEVLTVRVPKNGSDLGHFLRHVWAFDRARVTVEDRKRSLSYQQEIARNREARKAASLEDFISSLDLKVTIEPVREELIPRVAQLTQRTNQFNTTTIRRPEAEIRSAIASGELRCITIAVSDRFGDYGNVGAVLYSFSSPALAVDSFLLSCRALGRGVEHQIIRYLGNEALQNNLSEVAVRFIASPKNTPALQFLDSLECTGESGGLYTRLFRIKADYASRLTYRPVAYSGIEKDESPKAQTTQPGSVDYGSIDYGEIAIQLSTVEAIRKAMRGAHAITAPTTSGDSTAPRNKVEKKLADIWAEVLQRPSVGIHDNFFEIGGDSLRAVELLVKILDAFNVPDLTLTALLEYPTVAGFGGILGQQREVHCLVPLRETGSRPPLFCVPGGGGNVLSFRSLALNLPEDQPFWALQAPGLDGSATVDKAEDVASLYLEEIRTVQPSGPYYLGGGSYGGIIAYEMAQQLLARGEKVAFLGLLDTYNLAFGKMIPRTRALYCHARFFAQRTAANALQLTRTPIRQWPSHLQSLVKTSGKLTRKMVHMIVSEPENQSQPKPAGLERGKNSQPNRAIDVLERVRDANMRAVERYIPSPYPGKITLLRASIRMKEPYQDDYLGWKPLAAGGIEVEIVPGEHSGFDRRDLAAALDRHLRKAQSQVSQKPGWGQTGSGGPGTDQTSVMQLA
jgi:FkbH-like protein